MKIIYKVDVPECSHLTFRLGIDGVKSIKETVIQISSCAETQSASSKLIYEICYSDGRSVEISADLKGLVIHKIDEQDFINIKNKI